MREFRGAQAVVSGAASGIGRALALALAREGSHLFLVDVDGDGLLAVAKEAQNLGSEVEVTMCDLSQIDSVAGCAERILSASRPPRLLVNNAGVMWKGSARRTPPDEVERILAVNLLAPIRLTQRLLPVLLEQKDSHVLNICSLAGLVAVRGLTLYSASKFGLVGYSQGLRRDHGKLLGVTAICPGWVDTPILDGFDSTRKRKRRALTPDAVAERAIEAVRGNRSLVVMPPLARILWWAHRIRPGSLRRSGR